MESKLTSDLLRGNTDTMILKILLEQDCYGYEIIKKIAVLTNDAYILKEATMYSSVKRLENELDILWYWGDESLGGRRKYFRITDKGRQTYLQNRANWEYTKNIIDQIL